MDYDYDELFPGRFLKAGEFKGRDVTLKIVRVEKEEMPDKKGTKKNAEGVLVKVKPILFFEKKGRDGNYEPLEKGIILNKTNGECVRAMFGKKTKEWIGKRLTFYPAVVEAFGSETEAIRIRGSPDLEKDLRAELNLGQKTRTVTLKRTGAAPAPAPANGNGHAKPPPPTVPEPPGEEPPDDFRGSEEDLFAGEGQPPEQEQQQRP